MLGMKIRTSCAFLAAMYFTASVVFANAAQTNVWADRRKNRASVQMAALPGGVASPEAGISAILRQIPISAPALEKLTPSGMNPSLTPLPKSVRSLLETIPASAGQVKQAFLSPASSRFVVLVQDVHMNLEAQKNIVAILSALKLPVGVEGASGPFDFSRFRLNGDPKILSAVADRFFELKRISAPSYLGITDSHVPRMFGIDAPSHYQANVDAYKDAVTRQKATLSAIAGQKRALDAEKSHALNSRLRAFDALRSSYEEGTAGFGDYLVGLHRLLGAPDEIELPVRQFLAAYQLEKTLNFAEVERQRSSVMAALARQMNTDELRRLLMESAAYRLGRISYAGYYKSIQNQLQRHNIDLSRFPAFNDYIRYVALSDGIDAEKLLSAVGRMERDALAKFCRTSKERDLMDRSRRLFLQLKLVNFALTPGEWEEYQAQPRSENFGAFEMFYREADIRSAAMADSIATRVANDGRVVMLVGGFHTPDIARRLKNQGISFAVVQPRITKVEGDGVEYLSIFSREKTPLEKLFEGDKLFLAPSGQLAGNAVGELTAGLIAGTARALEKPGSETPTSVSGVVATTEPGFSTTETDNIDVPLNGRNVRVHFVRHWTAVAARFLRGIFIRKKHAPERAAASRPSFEQDTEEIVAPSVAQVVFETALLNELLSDMWVPFSGEPTYNLPESEKRLAYALAYVQLQQGSGQSDDQIFANAAKFLTPVSGKDVPPLSRAVLRMLLKVLSRSDLPTWESLLSTHVPDGAVANRYFDDTDPESAIRRLETQDLALEVEYTTSEQPQPIAPDRIAAESLNVFSTRLHRAAHKSAEDQSEDFGVSAIMPDGTTFAATIDGIGGVGHGDQASRIVGVAFHASMERAWATRRIGANASVDDMQAALRDAVSYAHQQLQSSAAIKGIGAGVVMVAMVAVPLDDARYRTLVVNIGDARAYLMQPKKTLINLTQDGLASPYLFTPETLAEQIQESWSFRFLESFRGGRFNIFHLQLQDDWKHRNITQTSLREGQAATEVGQSWTSADLNPGDSVVMLTDGIVDPLTKHDIAKILFSAKTPEDGLGNLLSKAQPGVTKKDTRDKDDDALAQQITFGKFSSVADEAVRSEIAALYGQLSIAAGFILDGDLEKANRKLSEIESALDTVPALFQRHVIVESLRSALACYKNAVEVLPPSFLLGEALSENDGQIGTVVYDGRKPDAFYAGKIIFLTKTNNFIAYDRERVLEALQRGTVKRTRADLGLHNRAKNVAAIVDAVKDLQQRHVPLKYLAEYRSERSMMKELARRVDDDREAMRKQLLDLGVAVNDNLDHAALQQRRDDALERLLGEPGTAYRLRDRPDWIWVVVDGRDASGRPLIPGHALFYQNQDGEILCRAVPLVDLYDHFGIDGGKIDSHGVAPTDESRAQAQAVHDAIVKDAARVRRNAPLLANEWLDQRVFFAVDEAPLDELNSATENAKSTIGNMATHADVNALLSNASEPDKKIIEALKNVASNGRVPSDVIRAILPLITPHAGPIGLKNALNARASAHLLTEMNSDAHLTRRSLAKIIPALLYLQKQGALALELDATGLRDAQAGKTVAPRLEISAARDANEAHAAVSRALKQAKATDGKILLAFNAAVLAQMDLTVDLIDFYKNAGVTFTSHERLPATRDALAELFNVSKDGISAVTVAVARPLQADSTVIEKLKSLSSEEGLSVNLYLLIDELSSLAIHLDAINDLVNIAHLDRLIATQA
jgi:serine/threonine protein phosphatase PrpC